MSAKHTPGPWTVAVNGRGTMLVSTPHDYIAEVFTGSPADGALIAAAPRLLAALQLLLAADDAEDLGDWQIAKESALAAIAEAVPS